jgi:hypothetical protein
MAPLNAHGIVWARPCLISSKTDTWLGSYDLAIISPFCDAEDVIYKWVSVLSSSVSEISTHTTLSGIS